ncbi:DNA translocase FtsK [Candidatus Microgenomates bacterium]|nr:DNA translocase FtsK [Candidatus Microgenomates bacterium]
MTAMRKRAYRKKLKIKLKKETIYTIVQLGLLGVAGIVTLSFFQQGSVLSYINETVTRYLGWGKVLLPLVLFMLSFQLTKFKFFLARTNVVIGTVLIWLTLLGLTKSGDVGFTVWSNFETILGGVAAFLILVLAFVVGLIVLFDASLEDVWGIIARILGGVGKFFKPAGTKGLLGGKKPLFPSPQLPLKGKGLDALLPKENKPAPIINKNAEKNRQLSLNLPSSTNVSVANTVWEYPALNLLSEMTGQKADRGDMKTNAQIIERTLESFGIAARVAEINKGPAVTQYALEIAMGTKLSKITALQNDLALALAAPTGQIRIEAPIPGKSLVGVEIPNRSLEFVTLKTMLSSDTLKHAKSKLTVALGLDVSGQPIAADLGRMPHVLIAGTTGSGKSVLVNSWITSILFRASPDEVKMIMVDPKRVELVGYNDIPHLMTPVIVEMDKTLSALKWAMNEMDNRYKEFAKMSVKNIEGYNNLAGFARLPYILILIDELADLMAFAPVEVEDAICRLAQMARATGIHLILSTQRPSVDVITGLIKANIPCRIAFNVSSMIDSRVILDQPGAEKLLGRGDMLYIPPDQAKPTRIQGTFVSETDINNLVTFLKSKSPVHYTEEVVSQVVTLKKPGGGETSPNGNDPLFNRAVELIVQYKTASSSFLQRKFSIGFSRAARLLDQLEAAGVVGPADGSKPRDVIITDASQIIGTQENTTSTL